MTLAAQGKSAIARLPQSLEELRGIEFYSTLMPDYDALAGYTNLTSLAAEWYGHAAVVGAHRLSVLVGLCELELGNLVADVDYQWIACLTALQVLVLSNTDCDRTDETFHRAILPVVATLPCLTSLRMTSLPSPAVLGPLADMSALSALELDFGFVPVRRSDVVAALAAVRGLERLVVSSYSRAEEVDLGVLAGVGAPQEAMLGLRSLSMPEVDSLPDPLAGALRSLTLAGASDPGPALARCPGVTALMLCENAEDDDDDLALVRRDWSVVEAAQFV